MGEKRPGSLAYNTFLVLSMQGSSCSLHVTVRETETQSGDVISLAVPPMSQR